MTDHPFGTYLRQRRASVTPADAGLAPTGQRRVPGLRRDEVAALVGVSTDYYTRLEQGRLGRPSSGVLDGLARALLLGPAERAHLHDLADLAQPRRPRSARVEPHALPRPELRRMLHLLDEVPALVMNDHTDVLAWNRLASALIGDFDAIAPAGRNMARLLFLHPESADRHPDWARAARDTVGILRMATGRDPFAPGLVDLVGELSTRSEPFRELWAEHHVHRKAHGQKSFRHPAVGVLDLAYETLYVPALDRPDPDLMLVVYTAAADSEAAGALGLLGSIIGTDLADGARSARGDTDRS